MAERKAHFTVNIDWDLWLRFSEKIKEEGYHTKSEWLREKVREALYEP